jgi:hypothetical protein
VKKSVYLFEFVRVGCYDYIASCDAILQCRSSVAVVVKLPFRAASSSVLFVTLSLLHGLRRQ